MTREKAKEYNKNLREYMRITDKESECKFLKENYEALDMSIKSLEAWDKVQEEIESLNVFGNNSMSEKEVLIKIGYLRSLNQVRNIIDKHLYEVESEG